MNLVASKLGRTRMLGSRSYGSRRSAVLILYEKDVPRFILRYFIRLRCRDVLYEEQDHSCLILLDVLHPNGISWFFYQNSKSNDLVETQVPVENTSHKIKRVWRTI